MCNWLDWYVDFQFKATYFEDSSPHLSSLHLSTNCNFVKYISYNCINLELKAVQKKRGRLSPVRLRPVVE